MNVNFNGFDENIVTFEADSSVTTAGVPVKMKSSGVVQACSSGDDFCGVTTNVRDGYAAVQLKGYVSMKVSGTVSVGYQSLACGENGAITVPTTGGKEHLVIDCDSTTIGFIL